MIRRILLATAVLWGCPGPSPVAPPAPDAPWTIRDAAGNPVEAGIAVTVTSTASGKRFPVTYTDRTGRVALSIPPGKYVVATTSPTQFAFVESVEVPGPPDIRLSPACHRISGQITGAVTASAALSFSRLSRYIGDQFVASVDRRGRADVCLPEGSYKATVTGEIQSLPVWVHVPDDTTVTLAGFPTSQLQSPPGHVQIRSDDLATFARALTAPLIVGMGEANHGTAEFFAYRNKLSRELARAGSLRAILLEADAMGMLAVDDYVMGAEVDLPKAVVALGFWITDVHELLELLTELRTHNAAAATADKIHILGVDAQYIAPPLTFLRDHRVELALSEQESDLLSRLLPDDGKAFTSMNERDRASLLAALNRLTRPARPADLAAVATRASIAARSISLQLGYFGKLGIDGLRDAAMADLAQYTIALTGAKQAALWAHNAHVTRIGRDGAKSLGQCLTELLGARYYPIAFYAYRGTARAWDGAGNIGVIPHELAPPPPYNLESVIMNAVGTPAVAWVRLDQPDRAWQSWLATPRYVREFGAAYSPDEVQRLRIVPAEFAATVVIDHTSPTTPTPTGVRKATP